MVSSLRDPWLWGLILLGATLKAPLLWLNEGEYTDGLILLGLFENGCPFYMPLFTAVAGGPMAAGMDPIFAGRCLSLAAHILTLPGLHFVAVWLTGSRPAGRWAAALYLVSPVPTRWAVRVMTDSLFALWWWAAVALLLAAAPQLLREERKGPICPFRATALALAAGALAALTRQTGWILLPLGLLAVVALMRQDTRHALRPAICTVLWLLPVAWMLRVGTFGGHGGQVADRFTWSAAATLVEAYALDWPLVVGWPVAVLAVWGLVRPIGSGARWRWFVGVMVWCIVGIIALQCLIQSYLFRYLLPLVGFACVLAGGALARLGARHPRAITPVATVALAWLALTTGSSLWLQRQAWGDFRAAAERMGELATAETHFFANETYPTWPEGHTTKAEWWSGQEVQMLVTEEGLADLPPGSLVLISSAYGGQAAASRLIQHLGAQFEIEDLGAWESRLTPLLPDLMDGPGHQHPLALRFRRVPQRFQTVLIRVGDRR